jgi:hypothetical protein
MRPDNLRALLRRRPFKPLRLHLTDGSVFDLTHPDMAIVTRSVVDIMLPLESSGERVAVVALIHIVWVEVIGPNP